MEKVLINTIQVGDRVRQDYGDIDSLAQSLQNIGLIQPIVLDNPTNRRLVAGGRRLAAAKKLGWQEIPVVYFGELDEFQRLVLEIEENVRRKDMTWQERVLSIAAAHRQLERAKILQGERWLQAQTGELFGISQASVSYALMVAEAIKAGDKEVVEAASFSEAIAVFVRRKEQQLASEVVQRALQTGNRVAEVIRDDGETGKLEPPALSVKDVSTAEEGVCINNLCQLGDAIELMRRLPPASIDHIFTDPPYAISMENLNQQAGIGDISLVEAEHQVDSNKQLLKHFISEAWRITANHSFCFVWGDLEHYQFIRDVAEDVGWRFQRWPLIWIKTTPCMNNAGSFNFTKTYEICFVLRKPNATLQSFQGASHWIGANQEDFGHPFQKPVRLWHWLMSAVTIENQLILDPFMGTGSCLIAALGRNLRPLGFEINPTHYARALINIRNYLTSKGVKVND